MTVHGMRYGDGCLEVKRTGEYLLLSGWNYSIEIRPRIVAIKGFKRVEVKEIYDSRKKIVFIYHDVVKELGECNDVVEEIDLGDYLVKVTSLFTGHYITIVTPGYTLIDYIVITGDQTLIILQGKRNIFLEEYRDIVTIYLN